MEAEALEQMRREGLEPGSVVLVRMADVRYLGQGFELEVPVASGELDAEELAGIYERFHDAHRRLYGYDQKDSMLEVVNLRVTSVAKLPQPQFDAAPLAGSRDPAAATTGKREIYFHNEAVPSDIYDRQKLRPGDTVEGPAIVEQLDSTTVIWPGQVASVDPYSNLILERK